MPPPRPANSNDPWTTRRLMEWMQGYFSDRNVDSPRVVADMLLSHVIGCERMRLYMEVDRPAAPDELAVLRDLVKRAGQHEPVQYLVGEGWFFGRAYEVNSSTLIPRPSTEALIECAVAAARPAPIETDGEPQCANPSDEACSVDPVSTDAVPDVPSCRILDIGTGTGCIAISLAALLPNAKVVATDVVPEALELARRNAQRHDVADRIEFRLGSLLDPVRDDEPFDMLCSNPPYILDSEWNDVAPNVRNWEPASALRAGVDGLEFIRPLLAGAADVLKPGGSLFIEIADAHGRLARDLIAAIPGLEHLDYHRDHEGLWRVVTARTCRVEQPV